MEPTFHLEGVIHSKEELEDFEGPLTLILLLLSKNKIEIRDIQISLILEQYLAYLDEMKAMDLEVASEFVQMASHLLYIKTKMLLSSDTEEVSELEQLIASLEQLKAKDVYATLKEVCPALGKAAETGGLYLTRQPDPLPTVKEYRYQHESWELLRALSEALRRGGPAGEEDADQPLKRRRLFPKRIVYNVREKSREILLRLSAAGSLSLREFYSVSQSRSETVAVFLSVLELSALGHTHLQIEGEEIIVSFTGGEIDEILKTIGE